MAAIYIGRGLDPQIASEVATQLMAYDALGAHARDELGISEISTARPIQAALASASTFAIGALMPCSSMPFSLNVGLAHHWHNVQPSWQVEWPLYYSHVPHYQTLHNEPDISFASPLMPRYKIYVDQRC